MAAERAQGAADVAAALPDVALLRVENMPAMQASLEEQVKRKDLYDSRNNLALLRLFQFHPAYTNKSVVENVLMKAITNLPEPCFQHALCLLPQSVQSRPTIKYLIQLENCLQNGQFKKFWEYRTTPEIAEARGLVDRVAGFDEHVRRFIVTALTITYQRIGVDQMKEALNLGDVRPLCAEAGWTVEGDTVLLPKNKENSPQARTFAAKVQLEDMAGLIRTLTK